MVNHFASLQAGEEIGHSSRGKALDMPRGAVRALLPIVSLLAAVAGAGTTVPTRDLLYLRPLGGNAPPYGALFLAAPDGTGARDVTPSGLLDVQGAAWAPDARRIAVSAIAAGDMTPRSSALPQMAADSAAWRTTSLRPAAELVAERASHRLLERPDGPL